MSTPLLSRDKPIFAVAVPHTPWIPDRVKSLQRLTYDLGAERGWGYIPHRTFGERAKNWVWSDALWRWGLAQDATHLLQIQDDAIVSPNFWATLEAMVRAVPDQVIGLEAIHPAGPMLGGAGIPWYTTSDCLVGVAYVMPRGALASFLEWREHALRPRAIEHISEDTLIGLWCAATGRQIWHPVPTIIDHDTEIPSTYANDDHPSRRPTVTWETELRDRDGTTFVNDLAKLERVSFWEPRNPLPLPNGPVPHLGRWYTATPGLMCRWLRSFMDEQIERVERDLVRISKARPEEARP